MSEQIPQELIKKIGQVALTIANGMYSLSEKQNPGTPKKMVTLGASSKQVIQNPSAAPAPAPPAQLMLANSPPAPPAQLKPANSLPAPPPAPPAQLMLANSPSAPAPPAQLMLANSPSAPPAAPPLAPAAAPPATQLKWPTAAKRHMNAKARVDAKAAQQAVTQKTPAVTSPWNRMRAVGGRRIIPTVRLAAAHRKGGVAFPGTRRTVNKRLNTKRRSTYRR
jgi:hypothetical protein